MDNAEPWAEGVFGNSEAQPHSQAVVEQLKQKKRQHTPGTAVGEVFDTPQAQQKAKLVHLQPKTRRKPFQAIGLHIGLDEPVVVGF
jgi:hypothetical protein